ncbi:MAG: acyltransferase [Burkholderiales bacterium]|nr:acyltransferase [Phycisphaerae bacterium]
MTTHTGFIPMTLTAREPAAAKERARLGLLDGARLLAAAGIVWAHVSATESGTHLYPALSPLGTFGVPFYLFIAMLFMARGLTRDPQKTFRQYFLSRLLRVYVPFLAWSAIYIVLAEAKFVLQDGHLHSQPWSTFYAGGHQHLWFLPFLMVMTMIGAVLVRTLEHRAHLRVAVAVGCVIAGAVVCFVPEPGWISLRGPDGDLEFWRFAFRALPSAFWATAFALMFATKGSLPRTRPSVAIAGAGIFILALLAMHWLEPLRPLRGLAGFGLVLVALLPAFSTARGGALEQFGSLGRYSYGVYLSHVVFVRIFVLWAQRFGIEPTAWLIAMEFAVVLGASLGLSIVLSRSRYTRWLLGE